MIAFALVSACSGASSDPGLRALIHVDHAQFVEGALPEEGAGPAIDSVNALHTFLTPGEADEQMSGAIAADGQAVVFGVDGDLGYWVLPADSPDPQVAGNLPTFVANISIAKRAPPGPLDVVVMADDINEVFGRKKTVPLVVEDVANVDAPLVVTLGWDVDADLDLHVVQPDGVEIWWGNINAYQKPPPGSPPDPPTAFLHGAVLDVDSNENCVRDGRNLERVTWPIDPIAGVYTVRVEASSLCGFLTAHWFVTVSKHDVLLASARGTSLASDTREKHGEGAGVTALTFTIDATSDASDAGPVDGGG